MQKLRPRAGVRAVAVILAVTAATISPAATQDGGGDDRPVPDVTDANGEGEHTASPPEFASPLNAPTPVAVGDRVVTPDGAAADAAGGGGYYAQFAAPLGSTDLDALGAAGVSIEQVIPPSTYVVGITPGAADALADLDGFLGLSPVVAADKLTPALRSGADGGAAPGEQVGQAAFYGTVELADAVAASRSAGLDVLDPGEYLVGNRLFVEGTASELVALASSDVVVWVNEESPEKTVDNLVAQGLHGSTSLQSLGLTGSGEVIGIWDEGSVRSSHRELTGRVTNNDTSANAGHSTHVAGTMIASGVTAGAEGMAPAATLQSYDFSGDIPTELTTAATTQSVNLSNHSYGFGLGRCDPDPHCGAEILFGFYGVNANAYDDFVRTYDAIVVKSAGNDRNDCGATVNDPEGDNCDGFLGADGQYYDNISEVGNAKNVITVGAIQDNGTSITSFSSAGPADDGRIKPDVVANGDGLLSSWHTADNAYGTSSGTSMAAPAVTGMLAQLQQVWRGQNSASDLPSDVAKALLVNTAVDLGRAGPDYLYGFGSVQIDAARTQLLNDGVRQGSVANGAVDEYYFDVSAGQALTELTMTWNDAPGVANSSANDIVNNLDVVLIAPDGTMHYPYTGPGRANPTGLATNAGPNAIDTVEQIRLASQPAGRWTVRVTGTSVTGSQSYAIASNRAFATNDAFAFAETIGGPTASVTGSNIGYTAEVNEPNPTCGDGSAGNSAWWNWTAPASGTVTIDTNGSGFDTILQVFTGSSLGSLSPVVCDDDGGSGNRSSVTFSATAGTTYRLQVDGYFVAEGPIRLTTSGCLPSYNDFGCAGTLTGLPGQITANNAGATSQPGEPDPTCDEGSPADNTLWFNWTAPSTARVNLDTVGSAPDTVMAVYTGNAVDSLTEIACNDQNLLGDTSEVSFQATAGTTYRIQVYGWFGQSGNIVLNVRDAPYVRPYGVVVNEGTGGNTVANAVFFLEDANGNPYTQSPTPIDVSWQTGDIPSNPSVAHPGSDFVATSGLVTFAPGESQVTVPITIIGDSIDEPPLLYGEWGLFSTSSISDNAALNTTAFFGLGLFIILDDD